MPALTVSEADSKISPDFEQIYRDYASMVYRTAKGVLGNAQDAEDVLQTIFLRLLRRELPPDLSRNPTAYLYRAAVNLSLDTIEKRRRLVFTDNAESMRSSPAVDTPNVEEELHRRLYDAIATLGREAAEILVLHYVHNISDAEIAKLLGTSRTVIAVRLFRLRARLKKHLRQDPGEES